jgi:hypothetical protein
LIESIQHKNSNDCKERNSQYRFGISTFRQLLPFFIKEEQKCKCYEIKNAKTEYAGHEINTHKWKRNKNESDIQSIPVGLTHEHQYEVSHQNKNG